MIKRMIFLTVLVATCYSLLEIAKIREIIGDRCEESDANLDLGSDHLPAYNADDIIEGGATGKVYDAGDGLVVKRISITDSGYLFKLGAELSVLNAAVGQYDIQHKVENGCFYTIKKYNQEQATQVIMYLKVRKLYETYFGLLNLNKDYAFQGMWHFDQIIKITRAVQRLHGLGFIHRDLKIENLMVAENPNNFAFTPVLIDFDLSIISGKPDDSRCGTKFYMPPEMGPNIPQLPSLDVYILGRLFYFLMNPFVIVKNNYTKTPPCGNRSLPYADYYCHDDLAELDTFVQSMVSSNPTARPSMDEVYAFFKQLIPKFDAYVANLDTRDLQAKKKLLQEHKEGKIVLNQNTHKVVERTVNRFPWTSLQYATLLNQGMVGNYPNTESPIWEDFKSDWGQTLGLGRRILL